MRKILDSKEAGQKTIHYFSRGYNCAQSILRACSETKGIILEKSVLKAASTLAGGIGYCGCVCGALLGSLLFIGVLYGDGKTPGRNKKALTYAREFYQRFEERFSASCCVILREGISFGDKRLHNHCSAISAQTAEMLIDFINETG